MPAVVEDLGKVISEEKLEWKDLCVPLEMVVRKEEGCHRSSAKS